MRKQNSIYLLALAFVFALSGCVVRTYQVAKDRLDQDLGSGNRGYLKGQAPYSEAKERKTKRSNQVVEIELHSPIKFEKAPKQKLEGGTAEQSGEDKDIWGNQGYLSLRRKCLRY